MFCNKTNKGSLDLFPVGIGYSLSNSSVAKSSKMFRKSSNVQKEHVNKGREKSRNVQPVFLILITLIDQQAQGPCCKCQNISRKLGSRLDYNTTLKSNRNKYSRTNRTWMRKMRYLGQHRGTCLHKVSKF